MDDVVPTKRTRLEYEVKARSGPVVGGGHQDVVVSAEAQLVVSTSVAEVNEDARSEVEEPVDADIGSPQFDSAVIKASQQVAAPDPCQLLVVADASPDVVRAYLALFLDGGPRRKR